MNPSACIKIVVSRPRGQALERLGFHAGRSRCLDPPGPRVQNRVSPAWINASDNAIAGKA